MFRPRVVVKPVHCKTPISSARTMSTSSGFKPEKQRDSIFIPKYTLNAHSRVLVNEIVACWVAQLSLPIVSTNMLSIALQNPFRDIGLEKARHRFTLYLGASESPAEVLDRLIQFDKLRREMKHLSPWLQGKSAVGVKINAWGLLSLEANEDTSTFSAYRTQFVPSYIRGVLSSDRNTPITDKVESALPTKQRSFGS